MALNMPKPVSQLRYDNAWTGKHKIQCYFKHFKMADGVDNLMEFMMGDKIQISKALFFFLISKPTRKTNIVRSQVSLPPHVSFRLRYLFI